MRLSVHPTLLTALGPFRRHVPLVVVLGLLGTALEGTGIALMIPLLTLVLPGSAGGSGDPPDVLERLAPGLDGPEIGLLLGLAILGLVAAKNLLAWLNAVLRGWIFGMSGHHLRRLLVARIVVMDTGFWMAQSPSRMIDVLSEESWRTADAVGSFLLIVVSLSASLMLLVFLTLVSPLLTGVVVLGIGLIHFVGARLSDRFRRLGGEVTGRNQLLAGRMLHVVGAWRLIRLFDREEHEAERFARTSDELRRAGFDLHRRQAGVGPAMEVAQTVLFLIVILVGALTGTSFARVATFMFLLYRLEPQVRHAQSALADLQGRTAALDAVMWLLQAPAEARPARGGTPAPSRIASGIRFDKVSLRYGEARPALREVSFDLPAGRSLAVIGRSGSGKSTVANLLCGLIRPTEGRILVDGVPLDQIDRSSWLSRIAVVSQELELFEGSVAENIRYGTPEASLAQVVEAARAADAHGFIEGLPQGYDTLVGDRGVTLSAGQRQRLALARALIREPSLLILDEATNALDLLSEAAVMRAIELRRGRATTVVISHHASSILLCDDLLRLEGGRIVETRPTEDLDDDGLAALLAQAAE